MIKVNEYFDGQVKSLGFEHAGTRYTAGVVHPGKYVFSTSSEEHLLVTLGALEIILPGQSVRKVGAGQTIIIPAGISFDIQAADTTSYLCSYH